MFSEKRVLARLDEMLEAGINGTFEESDYNESELSRLESKWLRYLTASKQTYQNTEKEREKIKSLVSDISHQTKTPLANILLYTELLRERETDEKSRGLFDEIGRQSEKLEFLIQSLVKTSRLETGTFQLKPEKNDVSAAITAAIEQAAPNADEKHINIEYEPESHTAIFDIRWTHEAIFNIIDNSIKYSDESGTVTVSVREYEMYLCISIADDGLGIAEDELAQIFGRFYRGKNTADTDGVGIGLYLSRQIIEGQGGYITADSAIGRGSVFNIFLPR